MENKLIEPQSQNVVYGICDALAEIPSMIGKIEVENSHGLSEDKRHLFNLFVENKILSSKDPKMSKLVSELKSKSRISRHVKVVTSSYQRLLFK
jgi:hypothetical protein